MNAKKSIYNIIFGLANQIITISLGIIIPRLFLLSFGSEVNGLVTSINQILVYLSLLEAGIGAASIQALYLPISRKDKNGINGILSATDKYYRKTGIYYFFAVLILALVYPFWVKSINSFVVSGVILLTGMCQVVNFFFQGKYKLLLEAEGKGYVTINMTTVTNILTNIIKIALLIWGFNIIAIQFSYFLINILQMIYIWWYIKRKYKWVDLNVKPNYNALSQKGSVLVHQISGMIFNNTDVLVLTIFCGLKVVSVYVMYNMLFEMINTATGNINRGVVFVLGQSYYKDKNKYMKLYDFYEVYYMSIVFALYAITYILILPFMKLYTFGITDVNYIDFGLPILFVVLKLLICARTPGMNAINISGHFKQTKNRSIIESAINIVLTLIFVHAFGVYGVLMGTIGALIYRTNDIIIYSNKYILNRNPLITYKRWFINIIMFIIIILVVNTIHFDTTSYIRIVIDAIILMCTILPSFIIINSIFDIKVSKSAFYYLKRYVLKLEKG